MKQITKQYKLLYFLLILLSLTSALLMTFFSLQLGRILDSISNSNSGLLFHITICVSSILLWFLISCSYSYLKNQYVKKVILDLKRRLLLHYLSRPPPDICTPGRSGHGPPGSPTSGSSERHQSLCPWNLTKLTTVTIQIS